MGLYTIGHSTLDIDAFLALLAHHRIRRVVDVRRFPGSRRHPQFGSAALAAALAAHGIAYVHEEALGGRRPVSADSPNRGWRNSSFRGYADHMATAEFRAALDRVLAWATAEDVVVMCAEAVPWRCHRNLIADAVVARGGTVRHIAGMSPAREHALSEHARCDGEGGLVYPGAPDDQPSLF